MKNQNIQFKRTTPPLRIVGSLLSALLMSLAALTARAQTAAVIDPQGDAFYSNGNEAPAFLDILAASITIADRPAGFAVLDSGERLGIAHHPHSTRGVGCAGTGSGCAARRHLELLDAQ